MSRNAADRRDQPQHLPDARRRIYDVFGRISTEFFYIPLCEDVYCNRIQNRISHLDLIAPLCIFGWLFLSEVMLVDGLAGRPGDLGMPQHVVVFQPWRLMPSHDSRKSLVHARRSDCRGVGAVAEPIK